MLCNLELAALAVGIVPENLFCSEGIYQHLYCQFPIVLSDSVSLRGKILNASVETNLFMLIVGLETSPLMISLCHLAAQSVINVLYLTFHLPCKTV